MRLLSIFQYEPYRGSKTSNRVANYFKSLSYRLGVQSKLVWTM